MGHLFKIMCALALMVVESSFEFASNEKSGSSFDCSFYHVTKDVHFVFDELTLCVY